MLKLVENVSFYLKHMYVLMSLLLLFHSRAQHVWSKGANRGLIVWPVYLMYSFDIIKLVILYFFLGIIMQLNGMFELYSLSRC